ARIIARPLHTSKKDKMNQQQKENIIPLLNPKSLDENLSVTHLLSQISQEFIKKHYFDAVNNEREADAKITIQIVHSKIRHLIELSQGIDLVDNARKKIIDPSVQIILSRSIFETVVFFNLLHVHHNDEDEQNLIYDLWKLSSLSYRQRFVSFAQSDEAIKLMQEETAEISSLVSKIKSCNIYVNGTPKTIGQIDQAIRKKSFWTIFEHGEVNTSYGPQKLCDEMTNGNNIIKEQYTRYSLFTHPSKETVNVFTNIFTNDEYKFLTGFNLRITNCLIAMFLCDYTKLFPKCKESFESMSIENQIVCSWYNKMIRDESSSINNSYENLDE
ncbi:MAG TPA: hypothetical protein DEP28_04020, partial [Bacteroidetes bacterium]|nr:hypothetical protein [Bacteroidota bacterium]